MYFNNTNERNSSFQMETFSSYHSHQFSAMEMAKKMFLNIITAKNIEKNVRNLQIQTNVLDNISKLGGVANALRCDGRGLENSFAHHSRPKKHMPPKST